MNFKTSWKMLDFFTSFKCHFRRSSTKKDIQLIFFQIFGLLIKFVIGFNNAVASNNNVGIKNYTTATISTPAFISNDSNTISSKIKLQHGVQTEFSKDMASILMEANLGSKCETVVFIVTPECENHISYICLALSFYGPPVILRNYEEKFEDLSPSKQIKWRQISSKLQQPCKIIFICAMMQTPPEKEENGNEPDIHASSVFKNNTNDSTRNKNTTNKTNTVTNSGVSVINKTLLLSPKFVFEEGFITFPKFVQYADQVLYFSNLHYYKPANVEVAEKNDDYSEIEEEEVETYWENIRRLEESENKVLNKSGVLLSIQLKNKSEDSESLFHVISRCRYCGLREQNKSLGNWKRNRTSFSMFFKTFDDEKRITFHNYHSFIIGYWNYYPHIQCEISKGPGKLNCTGAEFNILQQMSHALHFSFILKNFTGKGQQGSIYSEQNITGLIGAVTDTTLDFAIGGISISYEKISFMDFTDTFTNQPIVFVVEKRNDLYLLGIWLAFEAEVWPLIIFTILCVAVTVKMILQQTNVNRFKKMMKKKPRSLTALKPPIKISTFHGLEISIQPLLGQPLSKSQIPSNPRRILKIVLCLWWFASLIISTVYSTNLITSLINPVSPKEPESLQDLLDFNYRFSLGSRQAVFDLIGKGGGDEDSPFNHIKSRLADTHPYPSRIAYAVEESSVEAVEWKKKYELANIRVIKERLFLASFGWPLKKFAPYKEKLNTALNTFRSAGLVDFWYDKFNHKEKKPEGQRFRLQEKLGQVKLDLELLQGAFLFLIFGCIASSIVFFWNHIMFRYTFQFFTLQEITTCCKMLIRKFQEMDFEAEVTRVGLTGGIIIVSPADLDMLSTPNRKTKHKKGNLPYLR